MSRDIRDLIFPNFSAEKYFEKWYEETKDEDNFDQYVGFYDHQEEDFLIEIKSDYASDKDLDVDSIDEESEEFKKFYNQEKEKKIKDLAYDWFFDRLADFTYELEKVGEVTEKGIVCYRSIMVDDIDEFLFLISNKTFPKDYKGIGVCWSWHKDKAEAHWGEGKQEVIVKALIPFSAIEKERTLWLNMNPTLGEDEAEIRIKEGKDLEILEINGETFPEGFKIKS